MPLLIDAHLDLALNALNYDRDITLPLEAMNASEAHMDDAPFRGRGTVTLPEMRKAGIAVCIATLLAHSGPRHTRPARYARGDLDSATRDSAFCGCHAQLAYYRLLERRGEIRLLKSREDLAHHWSLWQSAADRSRLPIGVILSMEAPTRFTIRDNCRIGGSKGCARLALLTTAIATTPLGRMPKAV